MSVCGDGEYIIYTALAWRNKAFGSALDFVWGSKDNNNDYAIRDSPTSVKVYKNFVEKPGGLDVGFQAEGLTGGVLLGVKGQGGIGLFDWQSGGLVRRIEVDPKQVRTMTSNWIYSDYMRFTGRKTANLFALPAKIAFMCCASLVRTILLLFSRARLRMMELKPPSKLSRISMRSMNLLIWRYTFTNIS